MTNQPDAIESAEEFINRAGDVWDEPLAPERWDALDDMLKQRDALIRADERARVIAELESINWGGSDGQNAVKFALKLVRSPLSYMTSYGYTTEGRIADDALATERDDGEHS